jgi:hypothetical protein
MVEPNEQFELTEIQCAIWIRDSIKINDDRIQEIHEYYTKFGIVGKENVFDKFMDKKRRDRLGCRFVSKGKGVGKHIIVQPLILRESLKMLNIPIANDNNNNIHNNDHIENLGDIDEDDYDDDNDDDSDDDAEGEPRQKKRKIDEKSKGKSNYDRKYISNTYFAGINKKFDEAKLLLNNIKQDNLRKEVMMFGIQKLIEELGFKDELNYYANNDVIIKGISEFFKSVKETYKGTYKEKAGNIRCVSAFEVYIEVASKMPQPQSTKQSLMKLSARYHFFVCAAVEQELFEGKLSDVFAATGIDNRQNLIVVDDAAFYLARKDVGTLAGIQKIHQTIFKKEGHRNASTLLVRSASCSCDKCLAFDFKNCDLQTESCRKLTKWEIQDVESSFPLQFYGKNMGDRILGSSQWSNLVAAANNHSIVVVGLDLDTDCVQLANMIGPPKKALKEEEININGCILDLAKDAYYFPVQLLLKAELKRSHYIPNCYVLGNDVYKIPMHCIIPPKFNEKESRSTKDGKGTKTFANYISISRQEVICKKETINSIIVNTNDLRYFKGNTR